MVDRPILFSGAMVRALLAGRKKQTRRLLPFARKLGVTPTKAWFDAERGEWRWYADDGESTFASGGFHPGYAVADRLWVREEWCSTPAYDDLKPSLMGGEEPIRFLSDDATFNWAEADGACKGRRRAGMHMPRWASRLTLVVEDVNVERLQDISRDDAIAEGLTLASAEIEQFWRWPHPHDAGLWLSPVAAYRHLWDQINGDGAWDANPWVVAPRFRVIQSNIDSIGAAA